MPSTEFLFKQIKSLYETNPDIHLDVTLSNPKTLLKNSKAKIIGVYSHFFQVEEASDGKIKKHTIQYSDIITGRIAVCELNRKP